MTETEEIERVLHRLENAVALQGQQLQQNTLQTSRLYELVAGNGDGRGLVSRIISLEQKQERQRQTNANLLSELGKLKIQQHAWRNQAIGISATISFIIGIGLTIWNIIAAYNP
jgi:hypothetical protein